jgi:hypothetical protein
MISGWQPLPIANHAILEVVLASVRPLQAQQQ